MKIHLKELKLSNFIFLLLLFINCSSSQNKHYANIILECESLEKAIIEFVDLNMNNQILQERKVVIVEVITASNNEFQAKLILNTPARCSENLKGIIDLNYKGIDFYLYDKTSSIKKDFYRELRPANCIENWTKNKHLLSINGKSIATYTSTLANLYITLKFKRNNINEEYELINSVSKIN